MKGVACRKQPRSNAALPDDSMHEEAMEDERLQIVNEEGHAMEDEPNGKLRCMLGVSLMVVGTFICGMQ